MLINDEDHRYAWAFDTLSGIKNTIEERRHVTANQISAIYNIETSKGRR